MIAVNDDTYTHPAWHSVLLTIGIVIFSIIFSEHALVEPNHYIC